MKLIYSYKIPDKLYHASPACFRSFDLDKAYNLKDFGKGFYLTDHYNQALEWANNKRRANEGYIFYGKELPIFMNKKNCNNYISRQNELVKLFSAISGNTSLDHIQNYLGKSSVFKEIGNGNHSYLYDSLSANLIEIVDELKATIGSQCGSENITEKSISIYNMNRRLNIVETAENPIIDQAKRFRQRNISSIKRPAKIRARRRG